MGTKSLIIIVLIIAISIIIVINNNSEKNLDDVVSYDTKDFDYLLINHDIRTDKKEHAEELNVLLSKYRVKKMKVREWDSAISREKGYSITISANGKPITASIYENRLVFINNGNFYKVVNGPIDMDWFDKIYNKE